MISQYDSFHDDGFDFETFLQSDELATRQRQSKKDATIRTVSGSISTISSLIILIMLYRSHDRLSTTYHRLIFGLCMTDIISSVCFALNTLMVPADLDYWTWRARGNMISCNVQGFLLTMGVNSAQLYNASLCLYYLSIIRYEKSDAYIRKKIEPWLHGVSILYPLGLAIFAILSDIINSVGVMCTTFYKYRPPHCIGYKDGEVPDGYKIPCGKGEEKYLRVLFFLTAIASITTITVIVISMGLMYSTVRANEQKMERYGTSALKLRTQQRNSCSSSKTLLQKSAPGDATDPFDYREKRYEGLSADSKKPSLLSSLRSSATQSATQRNYRMRLKKTTKSRAILQRALAYTLAWFATYTPRFVVLFWRLANGTPPLGLSSATNFVTPLQGFFNFIVFIYPRVLEAKRATKSDISWWKALLMALSSRESHMKSKSRRTSSIPSNHHHGGPMKKSKVTREVDVENLEQF